MQRLPLGMVSQFPHDYMHLVCLGVVKRFLCTWINGHPLQCCLPARSTEAASERLIMMSGSIPREFARKPRSLSEVDRWKATGFRQFLLYTGPVVLKNILSDVLYNHFLLLFVGIRILCCPVLCIEFNEYANQLLRAFVGDSL